MEKEIARTSFLEKEFRRGDKAKEKAMTTFLERWRRINYYHICQIVISFVWELKNKNKKDERRGILGSSHYNTSDILLN